MASILLLWLLDKLKENERTNELRSLNSSSVASKWKGQLAGKITWTQFAQTVLGRSLLYLLSV